MSGELIRILGLLKEKEIRSVPVRGPVLASQLHDRPELRQMSGLYLMVPKPDLASVEAVLNSEGYESLGVKGHFRNPDKDVRFRLYTSITSEGLVLRSNLLGFWERLDRVVFHKKTCLSLSDNDRLLFLCLVGTNRAWQRLDLVSDVARLIWRHPSLDWDRVFEEARNLNCEPMLFLGLYMAHHLRDVSLSGPVEDRIQRHKTTSKLARKALNGIWGKTGTRQGSMHDLVFRCQVRRRLWDRLALLLTFAVRRLRWISHQAKDALLNRRDFGEYVPTPHEIVPKMLDLANVGPADVLYDMGCGDGRIVIAAARKYGIRGIGFDTDPERIAEASQSGTFTPNYQILRRSSVNLERMGSPEICSGFSSSSTGKSDR